MPDVLVCMISREGTAGMNAMLSRTIDGLRQHNYRLAAVHLEQGNTALSRQIKAAGRLSMVTAAPEAFNPLRQAGLVSDILLGGLKTLIRKATLDSPRVIVYMEGDKHTFVPDVAKMVAPILKGTADLSLAVRSPEGFARFPRVQQRVERNVNRYISRLTGIRTDYLYGPRAFSPGVVPFFQEYPQNDWGVIMYPLVAGIARGYRLATVEVPGYPQPGYMQKYDLIMRSPPAHLAWRTIQCRAIIRAARAASKKPS